jgi:hypothetical protein
MEERPIVPAMEAGTRLAEQVTPRRREVTFQKAT